MAAHETKAEIREHRVDETSAHALGLLSADLAPLRVLHRHDWFCDPKSAVLGDRMGVHNDRRSPGIGCSVCASVGAQLACHDMDFRRWYVMVVRIELGDQASTW